MQRGVEVDGMCMCMCKGKGKAADSEEAGSFAPAALDAYIHLAHTMGKRDFNADNDKNEDFCCLRCPMKWQMRVSAVGGGGVCSRGTGN